jgi:predicted nucleotidyltransferase
MQGQLTKQEVIEEMTRRLVEFYRPVRIYLFGSEARGEAGPDSDLGSQSRYRPRRCSMPSNARKRR